VLDFVNHTTSTIWAVNKILRMVNGLDGFINPNTSLNEKYNIRRYNGPVSEKTTINYYGIGLSSIKHNGTDGDLYDPIPFVMRHEGQELDDNDKKCYRFIIKKTINGITYICYMLKKINNHNIRDEIFTVDIDGDGYELSLFNSNNSRILNPLPTVSCDKFVAKNLEYDISLSVTELQEIENCKHILGKDKDTIREVCLFSGIDKNDIEGKTEAEFVQAMYFIGINEGIGPKTCIELGGMETSGM